MIRGAATKTAGTTASAKQSTGWSPTTSTACKRTARAPKNNKHGRGIPPRPKGPPNHICWARTTNAPANCNGGRSPRC
eukprot:11210828-Lingulodinium_polyedra.AAC.1